MKTKLFSYAFGVLLLLPMVAEADPNGGGGQETHGGFAYYYTSSELLDEAKRLTVKDLSALEDTFFNAFTKPIQKDKLIDIVRNCKQNPEETKYRVNPDGNREKLTLNYVVDPSLPNGGYVEALAPFFEMYSPFQKTIYDQGTVNGVLINIKEQLIHEALHFFQYDEHEAKDLSYILSSWFLSSPAIKNKMRYVASMIAIKNALREISVSLFRGWEETQLGTLVAGPKKTMGYGSYGDEWKEENDRWESQRQRQLDLLTKAISKHYTFIPNERLVMPYKYSSYISAHQLALDISKSVEIKEAGSDTTILIVDRTRSWVNEEKSKEMSKTYAGIIQSLIDLAEPYVPGLNRKMTFLEFLDLKTPELDLNLQNQFYLAFLADIQSKMNWDFRGYLLMNEFQTFGELYAYVLSRLEKFESPYNGRVGFLAESGMDSVEPHFRNGGLGFNMKNNITRVFNELEGNKETLAAFTNEVLLNINRYGEIHKGDVFYVDVRTSKNNEKYVFVRALSVTERNWLVDQGVIAPLEIIVESALGAIILGCDLFVLFPELGSAVTNESVTGAYVDSGQAIWEAFQSPFFDLYDSGRRLSEGDVMRSVKALTRVPISVIYFGETVALKVIRLPIDIVKSIINWFRS